MIMEGHHSHQSAVNLKFLMFENLQIENYHYQLYKFMPQYVDEQMHVNSFLHVRLGVSVL